MVTMVEMEKTVKEAVAVEMAEKALTTDELQSIE